MEAESEVEFPSDVKFVPLWRKANSHVSHGEGLYYSPKPRPQSYQSPNGLLITDFPVEDKQCFTVTQPAERITTSPESRIHHQGETYLHRPNGKLHPSTSLSLEYESLSPSRRRSSQVLKVVSNNSITFTNGENLSSTTQKPMLSRRTSSNVTLTPDQEKIVFGSSAGLVSNGMVTTNNCCQSRLTQDTDLLISDSFPSSPKSPVEEKQPLQRVPSNPERQSIVLSTNSAVSLKVGERQIIPKDLASDIKLAANKNSAQNSQNMEPCRRLLKTRSMVETSTSSRVATMGDGDGDAETESPGSLRRGLRSTSYRRAVVSGVDFNNSFDRKKNNRMSQPILKAVVEDKERFSSLGRIRRKILRGQGTFDGEENAVLYQNYKEKALDIDSDEEADGREPKEDRIVVLYKPLRSTWSQLSVVRKNGLSQSIGQEERKRQEAMFEVISSEHSYLLSLEILIRMFKNSKQLSSTMTKTENHHLFSNITDVCEASKKFFKELEGRHQRNILIEDISDIVEKHAKTTFDPYVKYCTNEVYQQRTLQKLISTNASFREVLMKIEAQEECRNLPMISFLILPMQRVTRLPLLMDTICQKTPKDSAKYEACKRALKEVSKLVRLCNEGARKMERTEMMVTINSQLEFKIKPFPLVSSSRWLLKRGELTSFVEDTGIFSRRTTKQPVYFFLFNDVLIITKKKSDESYNVTDYSMLDQLHVEQCDNEEPLSPLKNSAPILYSRQSSANHLFTLTIRSNYAGDEVEMLLGAETLSDRARWITALGQNREKACTDRTTLTQVEIIRTYTAKQPDELSLQVADVVLIYQKVNDGWYEGERLRDGERGWFPLECAKEITCKATIEKNMERMGRLLALETNV
ncbi:rho guanine nucleotide exchange factor 26 [Phyllobates terribilis]|uniref:rho guanine nucleotide exchange factor 26 n=1 Tax=Phyllobates terribilis TaxID=111132 RepID=UPI003CCA88E9